MLFLVWFCIRVALVGRLRWLFVCAWVQLCFECSFIYSLLPLLRMCLCYCAKCHALCGFACEALSKLFDGYDCGKAGKKWL